MSPFDGARAREIRLASGLCVEDLAAAAGTSPNTVRSAESGKHQPRPRVAAALARTLGVALRELTAPDGALTLRDLRCRLGLTQAQMAQRLGLGRQMVSRVERGAGGVRSPRDWAAAYEVSLNQWTQAHQAAQEALRRKVAARIHNRKKREGGRR